MDQKWGLHYAAVGCVNSKQSMILLEANRMDKDKLETKWVNVIKRLPRDGERVLVRSGSSRNKEVFVATAIISSAPGESRVSFIVSGGHSVMCSEWMPIPE